MNLKELQAPLRARYTEDPDSARVTLTVRSGSRAIGTYAAPVSLLIRNVLFTIVVPGAGAVWIPRSILLRTDGTIDPRAWYAVVLIAAGFGLYLWCVSLFGRVGRGTPGPWDAPRRFVVVGPYRWVRNPMYVAVLTVVLGEAWLFLSSPLVVYAGVLAVGFHLFVTGYEERTLRRRFGEEYVAYLRTVPRWIPRAPGRVSPERGGGSRRSFARGLDGDEHLGSIPTIGGSCASTRPKRTGTTASAQIIRASPGRRCPTAGAFTKRVKTRREGPPSFGLMALPTRIAKPESARGEVAQTADPLERRGLRVAELGQRGGGGCLHKDGWP